MTGKPLFGLRPSLVLALLAALAAVGCGGGKATVRGKVWPRGGKEPEDWAVEVVDPVPNTEGAPALYGYAAATDAGKPGEPGYRAGTNIYFENVTVTPNAAGGAAASRADKK